VVPSPVGFRGSSRRRGANAVPDELFDKAAMTTAEAAQNPAQQASETVANGPQSADADKF